MRIVDTDIQAVKLITPSKFEDHRGFFSETYSQRDLVALGDLKFVQDNHSLSRQQGVLRGLHFQLPPAAQAKLLRVIKGKVFDVAVDLRTDSSTFGQHISAIISAQQWNQILIPEGFAHGFVTLEPDTEVIYKVTDFYRPDLDRGIIWNDPTLGIEWPVGRASIILSDKDQKQPSWPSIATTLPFRMTK